MACRATAVPLALSGVHAACAATCACAMMMKVNRPNVSRLVSNFAMSGSPLPKPNELTSMPYSRATLPLVRHHTSSETPANMRSLLRSRRVLLDLRQDLFDERHELSPIGKVGGCARDNVFGAAEGDVGHVRLSHRDLHHKGPLGRKPRLGRWVSAHLTSPLR